VLTVCPADDIHSYGGALCPALTLEEHGMQHYILGALRPTISTTEPFRPLRWLVCPGNLRRLQTVARRAWTRDMRDRWAVPGQTTGQQRRRWSEAAREAAVEAVYDLFVDRDYGAAGITDDEPARAVLSAVAYCRRAGWRVGMGGVRKDSRVSEPYMPAAYSRGDNPAAVVATIESVRGRYPSALQRAIGQTAAREAIVGCPAEQPAVDPECTGVLAVEGGSHYATTRRMVADTVPSGWIDTRQPTLYGGAFCRSILRHRFQRNTVRRWRMVEVKHHRKTDWPTAVQIDAPDVDSEPPRYVVGAAVATAVACPVGAHCPTPWLTAGACGEVDRSVSTH
jgi:hypothetical protein